MPCSFNSHVFNIYIPVVGKIDLLFSGYLLLAHGSCIFFFFFFLFMSLPKILRLCWTHGLSPLICCSEPLGFGEHVTVSPANSAFAPFRNNQDIQSSSFVPVLERSVSLISVRRIKEPLGSELSVLFTAANLALPPFKFNRDLLFQFYVLEPVPCALLSELCSGFYNRIIFYILHLCTFLYYLFYRFSCLRI